MSFIKRLFNFFKAQSSEENKYTEPLQTPACPTCKINLGTRVIDEIPISICEKCNGIWVSEFDFQDLIHEDQAKLEKLFNYTEENLKIRFDYMSPGAVRKCPVCPSFMMNLQFDYSSGIWLDHCPNNHGVWLDAGEIDLVIQYKRKIRELGCQTKTADLIGSLYDDMPSSSLPCCPTCKVVLEIKSIDKTSFSFCNHCNGIWVDNENFTNLLKMNELEIQNFFNYKEENLNVKNDYMKPGAIRRCPKCHKHMMNIQFDSSSGIWLDHCIDEHGVWLDAGEINLVREYQAAVREGRAPNLRRRDE